MKIRIKDNSVRFRLTQTEVAALGNGETLTSNTHVAPGAVLRFSLCAAGDTPARATLAETHLTVTLPAASTREWATGDTVSIAASQSLGDAASLSLLIEKDFACLTERPGDDDADCFEHPQADELRC